jgi:16S rRNA (guanine527-N7)-methyltransferase
MPALSSTRIAELLVPYTADLAVTDELLTSIQTFIDLLLKWNAFTSLTAVRDPEELVQRQVGESLFAAQLVPEAGSLLDFGSGAGFPGIPIQLVRPQVQITLAESQGKKAGFLREAVRTLNLRSTVWAQRVETLPVTTTFDCVAMRAVDASPLMLPVATERIAPGGSLLRFTAESDTEVAEGWNVTADVPVPLSRGRLVRWSRQ